MPINKYLIQLKPDVDKEAHFERLKQELGKELTITHNYTILKAYAASFDDDEIARVRKHPDVEFVATDVVGDEDTVATQ